MIDAGVQILISAIREAEWGSGREGLPDRRPGTAIAAATILQDLARRIDAMQSVLAQRRARP
jgi:hypothetical protein